MVPENTSISKADALAEAYKRGLLPPDKKAAYEEAMKRGLVQPVATPPNPAPMSQPDATPWGDGQAFDDMYARKPQTDPMNLPLMPGARTLTSGQPTRMKPPPAPRGPIMSPAQRQAMAPERAAAEAERRAAQERREAAAAFGGGMDMLPTMDAGGNVRPGTEIDRDISAGITGTVSGIRPLNALSNTVEAAANLPGDALQSVMGGERVIPRADIPSVPLPKELESVTGDLSQGIMQFLMARGVIGKAAPGGGMAAQSGKDAAAIFAGFDSDTPRMAETLAADFMRENGMGWMADRDPNNPLMERVKNGIEEMFLAYAPVEVARRTPQAVDAITGVGRLPNTPTNAGGANLAPAAPPVAPMAPAVAATQAPTQPQTATAPPVPPTPPNAPAVTAGAAQPVPARSRAEQRADDLLIKKLAADGITMDDVRKIQARLARRGDSGVYETIGEIAALTDKSSGANLRGLQMAGGAAPGPLQEALVGLVNQNTEKLSPRLSRGATRATGQKADNAVATLDELETRLRTEAAPAYDTAYATPVDPQVFANELVPVLNTPSGQKALQSARNNLASVAADLQARAARGASERAMMESQRAQAAVKSIDDFMADPVLGTAIPTTMALDYTKRAFDDVIADAGFGSDTARIVGGTKRNFADSVSQATGGQYGNALGVFEDVKRLEDAFETGLKSLSQPTWELQRAMAKGRNGSPWTAGEVEALAMGVARNIEDLIEANNQSALTKLLKDKALKNMATALGSQKAADMFEETIRRLGANREWGRRVAGGSDTAMRQAAIRDAGMEGEDAVTRVLDRVETSGNQFSLPGLVNDVAVKPIARTAKDIYQRLRYPGVYDEEVNRALIPLIGKPMTEGNLNEVIRRVEARMAEKGLIPPAQPAAVAAPPPAPRRRPRGPRGNPPGTTSSASATGTGIVAGGVLGAMAPADDENEQFINALFTAAGVGTAAGVAAKLSKGGKPPPASGKGAKPKAPPSAPRSGPPGVKPPPVKMGFGGRDLPMDEARGSLIEADAISRIASGRTVPTSAELDDALKGLREAEFDDLVRQFGGDRQKAEKFRSLWRQAENAPTRQEADMLDAQRQKLIEGMPDVEPREFVDEYALRQLRDAFREIENGNAVKALNDSMTDLPTLREVQDGKISSRAQAALAILRKATQEARLQGLDPKQMMNSALESYGRRFSDPVDAEFMVGEVKKLFAKFDPSQEQSSKLLAGMSGNSRGIADNLKQDAGLALFGSAGGSFANQDDPQAGALAGMGLALGGKYGPRLANAMRGAGRVKPPPVRGADQGKFRGPNNQTFAGVNAKTADKVALARAQNMEADGAGRDAIWDETGWFKGVDGKWRFEIDDSGAKATAAQTRQLRSDALDKQLGDAETASIIRHRADRNGTSAEAAARDLSTELGRPIGPSLVDAAKARTQSEHKAYIADLEQQLSAKNPDMKLREAVGHSAAYDAYPDMAERPFKQFGLEGGLGTRAAYDEPADTFLSSQFQRPDEELSSSLHEMQHGVQGREGFARGGSPEDGGGLNELTKKARGAFNRRVGEVTSSEWAMSLEQDLAKRFGIDRFRARQIIAVRGKDGLEMITKSEPKGAEISKFLQGDSRYQAISSEIDDAYRSMIATPGYGLTNTERYRRLAGETEARNVQTRRDFTPEERRARRPWETQDVPDDQQIVRFGSGKAESRPKPPPKGPSFPPRLAADLNKSKVSPATRATLDQNAALPPGERKSVIEATGWSDDILRIAAPYIRPGTRMESEVGNRIARLVQQANANPVEYALRQTMAKGAYEEAQKRFKQASGARSRAANNLENLRSRNMLNPNQPATQQQLTVHKQRRDDAEQFLSEAARLRDEAKVMLDRADVELMSLPQVRDFANKEIQRITDALGVGGKASPGTAQLPSYNPMVRGPKPIPKPGAINRPSKQAADELAHLLFEQDMAEKFAKIQSGEITPTQRNTFQQVMSWYARHPSLAAVSVAAAGGSAVGYAALATDQGERAVQARENARKRSGQPEPELPGPPAWDWEKLSRNPRFAGDTQAALQALGYKIGKIDNNIRRADGKRTESEKALYHFFWTLDNTRDPEAPPTEAEWDALKEAALQARRKR